MSSEYIVLVKRPYTTVDPVRVELKTSAGFDGTGLLARSRDIIDFSLAPGGVPLKFDGKDNKFDGAHLTAGVPLFAVAKKPSAAMNDVELTLTLSGGSKKNGPPAKLTFTAVELALDICEPRVDDTTDPTPLPTAASAPTGGPPPTDKYYLGRPLPLQGKPKIDERATLVVRPPRPAAFKGNLELSIDNAQITLYASEKPTDAQKPIVLPLTLSPAKIEPKGHKVFVEGAAISPSPRATGVRLGIKGVKGDGDHVRLTVCHTEIVSNRKPGDLKITAIVAEKPERKSNSAYYVAPILIGIEYTVKLRPYVEKATPSAYKWSTPSDKIALKQDIAEVVEVTAKKLSVKDDDVPLEVLLTTDLGKLKKRHMMTAVQVAMDPVITGDTIKHTDPINRIRNPSGCVILSGTDAASANAVPRYQITKIEPALRWTDNDPRIAWRILGGDSKGDNRFDGEADFMNTDAAKRGTKIQVFGKKAGDIMIQPYSGGYAYGMLRVHVVPIRKLKYRVNRIFTTAQAAKAAVPAQVALPAQAAVPACVSPPLPAVPALAAVPAIPASPAVPARAAHAPTPSHDEAKLHMKIVNIYLRQMGFTMVPDNSAEMANPLVSAKPAVPAIAAQNAVAAQAAVPAASRPAVPARPAVAARAAVPAVAASYGNSKVGLSTLDPKVVSVRQIEPGHFDVEVTDVALTFNNNAGQKSAIRINARNEVISFAYISQDPTYGGGTVTLATALLCPANHAPKTRARQPEAWSVAAYALDDLGTPSTSLTPKTGVPPDVPADKRSMNVLGADVNWQAASPASRDVDLLWGIVVPTRNIDGAVSAPKTDDKRRQTYGATLAHEVGHVLGLGHRGIPSNPVADGLTVPGQKNLMYPYFSMPDWENLDLIQTKAVRFSELMFRNP
jgi:hypothetical protein